MMQQQQREGRRYTEADWQKRMTELAGEVRLALVAARQEDVRLWWDEPCGLANVPAGEWEPPTLVIGIGDDAPRIAAATQRPRFAGGWSRGWQLWQMEVSSYPATRDDPGGVDVTPKKVASVSDLPSVIAARAALLVVGQEIEAAQAAATEERLEAEMAETALLWKREGVEPRENHPGRQEASWQREREADAKRCKEHDLCTICGRGGFPICDPCCRRSDEAYDASREARR